MLICSYLVSGSDMSSPISNRRSTTSPISAYDYSRRSSLSEDQMTDSHYNNIGASVSVCGSEKEGASGGKRKPPKCARCRNHRVKYDVKGESV